MLWSKISYYLQDEISEIPYDDREPIIENELDEMTEPVVEEEEEEQIENPDELHTMTDTVNMPMPGSEER